MSSEVKNIIIGLFENYESITYDEIKIELLSFYKRGRIADDKFYEMESYIMDRNQPLHNYVFRKEELIMAWDDKVKDDRENYVND